jgi:hypothetical protein
VASGLLCSRRPEWSIGDRGNLCKSIIDTFVQLFPRWTSRLIGTVPQRTYHMADARSSRRKNNRWLSRSPRRDGKSMLGLLRIRWTCSPRLDSPPCRELSMAFSSSLGRTQATNEVRNRLGTQRNRWWQSRTSERTIQVRKTGGKKMKMLMVLTSHRKKNNATFDFSWLSK